MSIYGWKREIVGRYLTKVEQTADGEHFKLTFREGDPVYLAATAGCCSRSWVEYVNTDYGYGGYVTSVEDKDLGSWWTGPDEDGQHAKLYSTTIRTRDERDMCGWVTFEYRNESNGYYGGDLEDGSPPKDSAWVPVERSSA